MDWCAGCGFSGPAAVVCDGCRRRLMRPPDRTLPGGLVARGAWRHEGAARRMVLLLKYGAAIGAAGWLATGMAARLPPNSTVLVPVPRARLRAWRYGVDPAFELAMALAARTGLPVVAALTAPPWWPRHAGRARRRRDPPHFRARRPVAGAVLVDDVLTTGATLGAAARVLGPGVVGAVTATTRGVW